MKPEPSPPQYNEVVHQHQQNIPEPKRAAKREPEMPKPTPSNNEAEEIKRLRAELADALKKIEELSRFVQLIEILI